MENVEVLRPSRMRVEFALFEQDDLLHRGTLLVTREKSISRFGEPIKFIAAEDGERFETEAFAGLVIEHTFGLPAASLSLRYFQIVPVKDADQVFVQHERFAAALQMGVHLSEDWESVNLDGFNFAFKCKPQA